MKRILGFSMALLICVTLLFSAYQVQPVRAEETIYIRADGSIDPSTAPIQRDEDIYTFTDDILGHIKVERNNMTLDGAGYKLVNPSSTVDLSKGVFINYGYNVTVTNIEISGFGYGVFLGTDWIGSDCHDNNITRNNITECAIGIYSYEAHHNNITGNRINICSGTALGFPTLEGKGIYFYTSSNFNKIHGNNLTDNDFGIYFSSASTNEVAENIISNNIGGINLDYSGSNSLSDNELSDNNLGIRIDRYATNNVIFDNILARNSLGVQINSHSHNNKIYHNDFVNNLQQAIVTYSEVNVWDDGYPSGGNYWSDYSGSDADDDGIGDVPYAIEQANRDNYPLMDPYVSHFSDLQLSDEDIQCVPEYPLQNEEITVTASIQNRGNLDAIGIEATLLVNGTEIESNVVDIGVGQTAATVFHETLSVFGFYNFSVVVDPDNVLPEANETNNWGERNLRVYSPLPLRRNALLIDVYPSTGPHLISPILPIAQILYDSGYAVQTRPTMTAEWLSTYLKNPQDPCAYGIFWWRSEGEYDAIQTSEIISPFAPVYGDFKDWEDVQIYYSQLWGYPEEQKSIVDNWLREMGTPFGTFVGLLPEFFSEGRWSDGAPFCNPTAFQNSLIYIEACRTLQGDKFWKAFENRGAAAYIGYDCKPKIAEGDAHSLWAFLSLCTDNYDVETVCEATEEYYPPLQFRICGKLKLAEGEQTSVNAVASAVGSPVTILITDPVGRRTGIDPGTGSMLNEIPGSFYIGNDSTQQWVVVRDAIAGTYVTELSGISNGSYALETYKLNGTVSRQGLTGSISEGDTRRFVSPFCCRIQETIDGASEYDTVIVPLGTYNENLFVEKAISIFGGYDQSTTLCGDGTWHVISIVTANVTVSGFCIRNGTFPYASIYLTSSYNNITENSITGSGYGIDISPSSSHNHIFRNNITGNSRDGIIVEESSYNVLVENNIFSNDWYGVRLYNCAVYNDISRNDISSNGAHGVLLDASSYNRINGNNITANNWYGMYFWHSSDNNRISQNTIAENDYAIWLLDSSYNTFEQNNFAGNDYQILVSPTGSTNFWNTSYPLGGNYWSDYDDTDAFWGPFQDQPNSDGIGDTLYVIDTNNTDCYPLMKPWTPPDAAALNISFSKTIVGQGYSSNATVLLENQGSKIEELNATFYANDSCVGYQTFVLRSNDSIVYSSEWDLSDLAKGKYSLSIHIIPLDGEIDLNDNSLNGTFVILTILGDVNGDFIVDIYDAILLAGHFNQTPTQELWNANIDINGDSVVDIFDAIILASHFNEHYP